MNPFKTFVAANFKLLHKELVRDGINADKFGMASCHQSLSIAIVRQAREEASLNQYILYKNDALVQ